MRHVSQSGSVGWMAAEGWDFNRQKNKYDLFFVYQHDALGILNKELYLIFFLSFIFVDFERVIGGERVNPGQTAFPFTITLRLGPMTKKTSTSIFEFILYGQSVWIIVQYLCIDIGKQVEASLRLTKFEQKNENASHRVVTGCCRSVRSRSSETGEMAIFA